MNRQVVCAFLGLAIVIAPGTGSTQEFVETAKLLVDDVDAGIELGRRVAVS